jgi:hypothetical protein
LTLKTLIPVVLAALAIAAPAGAAEVDPAASGNSWGAEEAWPAPARMVVPDGPERALPAVQDHAFHFTRPGG